MRRSRVAGKGDVLDAAWKTSAGGPIADSRKRLPSHWPLIDRAVHVIVHTSFRDVDAITYHPNEATTAK